MDLPQAGSVSQAAGGAIEHQQDGQHRLVGGQAQEKGQQNGPVQAEEAARGIQQSGKAQQQALPAGAEGGQAPEQRPCRSRHRRGPAQDEEAPIQEGAEQHLSHLGLAVRRQLQHEGRGRPPQEGFGEQRRCGKGRKDAAREHQAQKRSGQKSGALSCEEHGKQGDEQWEAAVAGGDAVG